MAAKPPKAFDVWFVAANTVYKGVPYGVVAEQPVELPDPKPGPRRSRFDEDDDVDMIPLIDISMVLLVFFIMVQATGAMAPTDVPEMRYAGQLSTDPNAITIT